jgi:uncharacterized protein
VIGFWQLARPGMFRRIGPGSLYWAELDTWDGARADAFFADLFGYQQYQIGDGIEVDYTTWSRDGETMLGQISDERGLGGLGLHCALDAALCGGPTDRH